MLMPVNLGQYIKTQWNRCKAWYKAYSNIPLWFTILPERISLLKKVAIQSIQITARGYVLDIGTGPGYLPIEMAKLCPNLHIIGIDIALELIESAIKRGEKAAVTTRVNFFRAAAEYLPFADNTFETVNSTMSFHQWQWPQQGITEIQRVLKPGGRALILIGRTYLLEGMEYFTDWFTGKSTIRIRNYFLNAGFKEIAAKNKGGIIQIIAIK